MSPIGKVFVILNLVFSLVIVGAAAAYLSKADEWKQKYDELQGQYDREKEAWEVDRSNLESKYRSIAEENDQKQNRIEDFDLQVSNLSDQLKSEKVDNQQLRDDVSRINSVLQNFQTNINELNARNKELADQNTTLRTESLDAKEAQKQGEEDLIRLQGELETANEQLNEVEIRVSALDQEKEHLTNILEVAKQKGFDISSIVAVPEIPAYIEKVNNELGFVILSVGSDDKVQKGYVFHVYRGDAYLGEVQVDDVYPDRCAASIKFRVDGAQFNVNDKATTVL